MTGRHLPDQGSMWQGRILALKSLSSFPPLPLPCFSIIALKNCKEVIGFPPFPGPVRFHVFHIFRCGFISKIWNMKLLTCAKWVLFTCFRPRFRKFWKSSVLAKDSNRQDVFTNWYIVVLFSARFLHNFR